jgi:hypothetical protein
VKLIFLSKPRLLGFVADRGSLNISRWFLLFISAIAPLKLPAAAAIRAVVPESGYQASANQFHLVLVLQDVRKTDRFHTWRREESSASSALMLRFELLRGYPSCSYIVLRNNLEHCRDYWSQFVFNTHCWNHLSSTIQTKRGSEFEVT